VPSNGINILAATHGIVLAAQSSNDYTNMANIFSMFELRRMHITLAFAHSGIDTVQAIAIGYDTSTSTALPSAYNSLMDMLQSQFYALDSSTHYLTFNLRPNVHVPQLTSSNVESYGHVKTYGNDLIASTTLIKFRFSFEAIFYNAQ